jgi:S-DNA-T family DNA segregation ATPase FtsK/SpoIIIE
VYRILSVGSDFHEICDECGFHGGTLDLAATVERIRSLPDRWSEVMSQDEELLRARPEPDTWCAVEYAQHIINAIASIEWGARIFAAGRSPDWDELSEDSLPAVFEHPTHECDRFDIAATLDSLGAVAGSMATFAESLTLEEQATIAVYVPGQVLNTTAVIRHALHDAEHHLLDVRRGIARQQLRP